MPVNLLAGPASHKAFAAIIAEALGSEGTYVAPTAQIPVDDASVDQSGGVMGMGPLAGSRLGNPATVSTELAVSGSFSGPFTNAGTVVTAAMAIPAGDLTAYSININMGNGSSVHVAGALFDKYTVKGAVNGRVDYTASFKAQSAVGAADVTAPTAAPVTPFGTKEVQVTGPLLAVSAASFEISIDNAVKTQMVYNQTVVPAFVFATNFLITGKVTMVATGIGDIPTIAAGTKFTLTVVLTNVTSVKTFTITNCYATKLAEAVKVGSLTMQDMDFIGSVNAGAAALTLT